MVNIKNSSEYDCLNSVYEDIAEEFGVDIAKRIYEMFKGLQINFPLRFFNKRIACVLLQSLHLTLNMLNSEVVSSIFTFLS